MSFLKDLRRRSKTSFRSSTAHNEPSARQCNGQSLGGASSSTLASSSHDLRRTPPSSVTHDHPASSSSSTPSNHTSSNCASTPRQRPVPISSQASRSSIMGVNSLSANVNGAPRPPVPSSPLAPRIESISDNSWVHQKVLLVYGRVGDTGQRPTDGTLTISHAQDSFPPTSWPIRESCFKALVHLVPGPNKIRFDYAPPDSPHVSVHSSWISINYLPLLNVPPLQLAIVLGKDSDAHFRAISESETPGVSALDAVVRKFRMAAYLWQAFTGEQMYRNNFGRRCFRYDEEWQAGTLSSRDVRSGQMRNEAKVHIVRCEETVAELRALSESSAADNALYSVTMNAIVRHFNIQPGQRQYVSAVVFDSDWLGQSSEKGTLRNLAAGRGQGDIKMTVFGSHSFQLYPSSMEEMGPMLMDCNRADVKPYVNGNSDYISRWQTATPNIVAHMRRSGHIFGCPTDEGEYSDCDHIPLNPTSTAGETYSTRRKSHGPRPCTNDEKACWSRRETLRFRFHPCFRLPSDAQVADDIIQIWPVDNGKLIVTSTSGIAFVEIFVADEVCRGDIEYVNADAGNSGIPKQVTLTEEGVRHRLPERYKKSKSLKLVIYSGSLRARVVEDFVQLLKSTEYIAKLVKGQTGFRGPRIGSSNPADSTPEEIVLQCTINQSKLLVSIKIYFDTFITGIAFCYEDSTSQLFGKPTEGPPKGEFVLDTRRGEVIMGFYLRYAQFVEGLEIWTSLGRKSGVYGNSTAGVGLAIVGGLTTSTSNTAFTLAMDVDIFAHISPITNVVFAS